jgi:hypothetical protein
MIGRNCLGAPARESGHRRVPPPPERITGRISGKDRSVRIASPQGLSAGRPKFYPRRRVQNRSRAPLRLGSKGG